MIKSMSLAEKVGQLFIVSFDSTTINGQLINLITTHNIGGVCYSSRNFNKPQQVHKLSSNLQRYAGIKSPLFIGIDPLNGPSNFLSNNLTTSPNQQKMGEINNRLYTKLMAEIVGKELYEIGINLNIAPSLDPTENENSFSTNLEQISRHGLATIQGYEKANILAAAKIDAFLYETIVKEIYDSTALQPLIHSLLHPLEIVSVSGKTFQEKVENKESYLSILTDFLRNKLNYERVIMINELESFANADQHAAITALEAGADLILINDTYENQLTAINSVIQAVMTGDIAEERIDQSVERVLQLKEKWKMGQLKPFNRDQLRRKRSLDFSEKLMTYV